MNSDKFEFWGIEVEDRYQQFYELFDSIKAPEHIILRDKLHKIYKDLGITPKNPINALKELDDKLIIDLHYKAPESDDPPFHSKVSVTAFKHFPKKHYYGESSYGNKRLAKIFAHAIVCDQLFLPYHLRDWTFPISLYKEWKDENKKE